MATTTGHIFTIEQYGSFKISPETTEPFKSRKDRNVPLQSTPLHWSDWLVALSGYSSISIHVYVGWLWCLMPL